jgi:hypothetical protein
MPNGFLPGSDAGLLQWAAGFSSQITSTPTVFGLSASQATSYAADLADYSSKLTIATSENTRTKGSIAGKNSAKDVLRQASMALAGVVRSHPGITDQQLLNLGLRVKQPPAPVPPVALAPLLQVVSVTGRVSRYKLADAAFPSSRRKPANATGAILMTYCGATPPPAGDAGWRLQGQTGRLTAVVEYPSDVTAGTACWAVAMWVSPRGEYSPPCAPVPTYLQVGPMAQAA